jgi:hypothetical protein
MFHLQDLSGVYADAFVTDSADRLLFGSFWGRDTAIQGLLARLSLSPMEGGLGRLRLIDGEDDAPVIRDAAIDEGERLAKLTGRMPKANLFGDIVQVWLYDRLAATPDYGARRALRLFRDAGGGDPRRQALESDATWRLMQDLSPLPLLDGWRETIVHTAIRAGWLAFHAGIGVHAVELNLAGDELEMTVGDLICAGQLRLEGVAEPTTSTRLTSDQLARALAGFTGTTAWFRHALVCAMTYTEGVRFFAQAGGEQGAYWFLDVVATEFYPLLRTEPFLVITVSVADRQALIRVDDGNNRVIREKTIEFTDLQPGTWRFYLTDDVLLLPGEY